jgi:hypothetical protein
MSLSVGSPLAASAAGARSILSGTGGGGGGGGASEGGGAALAPLHLSELSEDVKAMLAWMRRAIRLPG